MRLPQILAAAALVCVGSLAVHGPANAVSPSAHDASPSSISSPAAADVCAGSTAHQNLSGARSTVLASQPVRSGPAAGCGVRFTGQVRVDVHCYRISNGNVWWFVDTNLDEGVTDQQGWVFEGNLNSAPSRNQTGCQGPEFRSATPSTTPVAAAAADCAAAAHENRNAGTSTVIAGRSARSSYYEECNERFTGGSVSLHCWQLNARGNVWWFAKNNGGAQGWVFVDNLSSRPGASSDKRCPGATVPPPS